MGFSRQKVQLPEEDDGDLLKSMRKLHNGEAVDEDVVLVQLELFSRPLTSLASGSSSSGKFKKNSVGAVLRHDFFVLTVLSKDGSKQESCLFEKLAEKQCGVFAGTKVNVTTYHGVENEKSRLKRGLKRSKVPVNALYATLIKEAREYNVLTFNCWHYGHEIPKEIIRLALKDPEMSEADKAALRLDINSVEKKERPTVSACSRLIYNPRSPANEKTWNKLENRAEGKPRVERCIKTVRKVHNMFL